MDLEAIIGLGASPAVVYALTQNINDFVRAIRDDSLGDGTEPSEWPLVASLIGAGWMVAAFYAQWLPAETIGSPLGAALLGIAVGTGVSTGYKAMKG